MLQFSKKIIVPLVLFLGLATNIVASGICNRIDSSTVECCDTSVGYCGRGSDDVSAMTALNNPATRFPIGGSSAGAVSGGSGAGVAFTNPLTGNPGTSGDPGLSDLIDKVMGFLFGLAIVVCPILILWGTFLVATSAGAEEKTKQGRQIIQYAVIGLVVIGLSGVIKAIIFDIVTTK